MNAIKHRIEALRRLMQQNNLQSYYISGTDPHSSEYLPPYWETRRFISGFTGSYGEVVVTADKAVLWTDTRYFIQAEEELAGTGIEMHKLRVPGAVPPAEWLASNLPQGSRVGADPFSLPALRGKNMYQLFSEKGLELVTGFDLLGEIWDNRPLIPSDKIFELETCYTGFSRAQKFEIIAEELRKIGARFLLVSALDEIAWAFNLRGDDIAYNPFFYGYALIGAEQKILFADKNKFPETLYKKLENEGIALFEYADFPRFLSEIKNSTVSLDPLSVNMGIYNAIDKSNKIIEGASVIALLKARKNPAELEGFRNVMRKDGVAMVKFLWWLKNTVGEKPVTEFGIGRKLAEFRAEGEKFKGESFEPIVGYKAHGAMVHLSVNSENAYKIEPEGLLLFDSGGHYLDGTSDITRTVALGALSERQKHDFTLVLKGMIALSRAKFPYGTKGCHLDILARKFLWENGLNYGHGTGHGVGHFLCVHEGPLSIRQDLNENTLEPGMVLTNEPGIYREGEYGIRTENMMVCAEKEEIAFGRFLGFETLTLCPIDLGAIEFNLLSDEEIIWLNQYHRKVKVELSPFLNPELQNFLDEITQSIIR